VIDKAPILLAAAGSVFVLVGLWWLYPPLALVVLGTACVWVALRIDITGGPRL
jgi:hypothetical protein